MSAEGWAIIITAIFLGISKVVDTVMVYRLKIAVAKNALITETGLKDANKKMDAVVKQTNGMQQALIKSAGDKGFADGVKHEQLDPTPNPDLRGNSPTEK